MITMKIKDFFKGLFSIKKKERKPDEWTIRRLKKITMEVTKMYSEWSALGTIENTHVTSKDLIDCIVNNLIKKFYK